MSRLVNGLLLLARADAQQHLSRSPLQLEPLIKDAWRTARSLSDSVSVKLGDIPTGWRSARTPIGWSSSSPRFSTMRCSTVRPGSGLAAGQAGDSPRRSLACDRSRRCGAWHSDERALTHFRALLSLTRHGDGDRRGWARPGRRPLDRGRARGGNQRHGQRAGRQHLSRCGYPSCHLRPRRAFKLRTTLELGGVGVASCDRDVPSRRDGLNGAIVGCSRSRTSPARRAQRWI